MLGLVGAYLRKSRYDLWGSVYRIFSENKDWCSNVRSGIFLSEVQARTSGQIYCSKVTTLLIKLLEKVSGFFFSSLYRELAVCLWVSHLRCT